MGWLGTSMAKGGVRAMNAGQKARDRKRRELLDGSSATLPDADEREERRPDTSAEDSKGERPPG